MELRWEIPRVDIQAEIDRLQPMLHCINSHQLLLDPNNSSYRPGSVICSSFVAGWDQGRFHIRLILLSSPLSPELVDVVPGYRETFPLADFNQFIPVDAVVSG